MRTNIAVNEIIRVWSNRNLHNKCVGPSYCRAQMYAGRIACCLLVSHDKYADGTDRQTNEQTPDSQTPDNKDAAIVTTVTERAYINEKEYFPQESIATGCTFSK